MICFARSGVSPITEIMMSTRSDRRYGMRFAPVTCVISSFAPSAFATISASSMSKPSGWRCWLTEPKGGASTGTPMRTTPFERMSWNLSAPCATAVPTSDRPSAIMARPLSPRVLIHLIAFFSPRGPALAADVGRARRVSKAAGHYHRPRERRQSRCECRHRVGDSTEDCVVADSLRRGAVAAPIPARDIIDDPRKTEQDGGEDEKVGLQHGHQSNLRKRRLATKCMAKPVKSQARLKIVVIQSAGKVLGVLKVSVANGATKPATMTASPKLLRKVADSLVRSLSESFIPVRLVANARPRSRMSRAPACAARSTYRPPGLLPRSC